jgi:hypothetical protein
MQIASKQQIWLEWIVYYKGTYILVVNSSIGSRKKTMSKICDVNTLTNFAYYKPQTMSKPWMIADKLGLRVASIKVTPNKH